MLKKKIIQIPAFLICPVIITGIITEIQKKIFFNQFDQNRLNFAFFSNANREKSKN